MKSFLSFIGNFFHAAPYNNIICNVWEDHQDPLTLV